MFDYDVSTLKDFTFNSIYDVFALIAQNPFLITFYCFILLIIAHTPCGFKCGLLKQYCTWKEDL